MAYNQAEQTNRAFKAEQILELLDAQQAEISDEPLTSTMISQLSDEAWEAAAQLAGWRCRKSWTDASEKTRATVIGILRAREATPNPFDGFPNNN